MSNYILYILNKLIDFPGGDFDGDDMNKLKNNTIIGDGGYDDNQDMLRNMLMKNLMNLPGATPMNTQMDDEKD